MRTATITQAEGTFEIEYGTHHNMYGMLQFDFNGVTINAGIQKFPVEESKCGKIEITKNSSFLVPQMVCLPCCSNFLIDE